MQTHCGDETCPSCVVAGDYIFLAHHGGGLDKKDIKHQARAIFESMKRTLASVGATLDDMVQIQLYLKDTADFDDAREVFFDYFTDGFPARMTVITQFLDDAILCQMTGIAYKPQDKEVP
jgi:2-iminobutanoate/2-iminopropanoate deaminase